MQLLCNGEEVGTVQSVEWKEEAGEDSPGVVAFMAPFDFDWSANQNAFLELKDEEHHYMIPRLRTVDEGSTGSFVSAEYSPLQ